MLQEPVIPAERWKRFAMVKKLKYERPALIDMQEDSAQAAASCYNGTGEMNCSYGSCVASAQCAEGEQTGYCWNGNLACGGSSQCYTCCQEGNNVGVLKSGKGSSTSCSCNYGNLAMMSCTSGWRASYGCTAGSYYIAGTCG